MLQVCFLKPVCYNSYYYLSIMSSTKTSKALMSRIRLTKRGKILARGKGQGHFNAKHPRSKKLKQKKLIDMDAQIPKKMQQRYIIK